MQAVLLSQNQLLRLILLLKESLTVFDKQCYQKIVFFNEWCLYQHVRDFAVSSINSRSSISSGPAYKGRSLLKRNRAKGTTIGVLLDIIEPYIPFKLSEDNFELFMDSVLKPEDTTPEFSHKAKLDFIQALRTIRRPEEWNQTLAVCESIRQLKEELAISQV